MVILRCAWVLAQGPCTIGILALQALPRGNSTLEGTPTLACHQPWPLRGRARLGTRADMTGRDRSRACKPDNIKEIGDSFLSSR